MLVLRYTRLPSVGEITISGTDIFMRNMRFMVRGYGFGMLFEGASGVCGSCVAIEEPRSGEEAFGLDDRQGRFRVILP